MSAATKPSSVEGQNEALRALVEKASLVIAHYWPMTGFVHHNPIRSLETYPFEEAVRKGKRFVGGDGYLTNETYRRFVASGRITAEHVDAALKPLATDGGVDVGGKTVSQLDMLRAHLLNGVTAPAPETLAAVVNRSPNAAAIRALAEKVTPADVEYEADRIGRDTTLAAWCDERFHTEVTWLIDREIIKWCEGFLDEAHASWEMPDRTEGFYSAWRALAAKEWSPCGIAGSRKKIAALPSSPDDALLEHLDALGIPEDLRQEYLSHELTALSGWTSFINWRQHNPQYAWQVANPVDLIEYLAVRLFYVRHLVAKTCKSELGIEGTYEAISAEIDKQEEAARSIRKETAKLAAAWRLHRLFEVLKVPPKGLDAVANEVLGWLDAFPESEHGPTWLRALEAGYHEDLVGKLKEGVASMPEEKPGRPLTQSMYCIDVRSEPFRRALESVGNHETIGFAGFFGIAIQSQAYGQHHWTEQYPAIAAPAHQVHEVPRADQDAAVARHGEGKEFLHSLQEILHDLKAHLLTPFVTVESLGWLFAAPLVGRTMVPARYRKWKDSFNKAIAPPPSTIMTADSTSDGLGMTSEEQAAAIEGALRTMGLTENFARLVLICGHTSVTDNNPYESALDCGACGGNPGKPNARIFAYIANKPHVREHLAKNGIEVPEDTVFVGGLHDTTTDIVEIFDAEDIPDSHSGDYARLKKDLQKAKVKTNMERCIKLPSIVNDPSPKLVHAEIERRAGDWSDTRPEWGLSGNASFIIGGRELTKRVNLEGRAFLNSHDWKVDPTGACLTGILNGPMVVGQWINAEHYFSATDPENYGSGSKIYHNVVGRIGIMSGPQSDLRTGLAWQSVIGDEQMPFHEPVRLFVAVEAPRGRLLEIVQDSPVLTQLCDNEWIHLFALDPEEGHAMYRYEPKQGWTSLDS